jgi:uncharacterized protein YggE
MRRFLILSACLMAAPAFAQTREVGLSAEATETIRLQPDTAKIYFVIETKDPNVDTATEANVKLKKDLTDALEKLAVKGLTTKATQKTVSKESQRNFNGIIGGGGPGGGPPVPVVENVSVSTPIILTLSNADSAKLIETVEKILQSAATLGISGPSANDNQFGYNPFNQVTSGKARVVYSTKAGWDDSTDAALAKATARAKAKATSLAKGAGVTLGDLITVQEQPEGSPADGGFSPYIGRGGRYTEEPGLVDGELVKTIRVRVTYAVK